MRISWLIAVLLAGAPAVADTPKPDLVLTYEEGEQSRDSSRWTTRVEVTGTKLHYSRKYEGRESGRPGTKPVELDAVVKDPKKVAATLATFDGIKTTSKLGKGPTHYRLRSGCILRGKAERCAAVSGEAPDPADLKAIAAVRDALLDGVKVPVVF